MIQFHATLIALGMILVAPLLLLRQWSSLYSQIIESLEDSGSVKITIRVELDSDSDS